MKPWLNLSIFTFYEVVQGRVFQFLLLAAILTPLFCYLLSSLFLVDVGKVYMDAVIGLTHLLMIVYILFISVSLMARDVEQKVCYLLLAAPVHRLTYVWGRFFGLLLGMLALLGVVMLCNALLGELYMSTLQQLYRSNFAWHTLLGVITLHGFQYITLLGVVFFIFSWATGAAEIMLFSLAAFIFSWVFPPVLLAMQQQDMAKDVPMLLQNILNFIYQMLPHLNGSTISLTLAHGRDLAWLDVGVYIIEHLAYTGLMLLLALWKFSKRDL